MKTKAIRLYGADDIRLEEFELPEITADEVLIRVVSDSVCASTYKAIKQGGAHKRVPNDVAENPIIIGHEMCGEIISVGENIKNDWQEGQKIVIQPALKLPNANSKKKPGTLRKNSFRSGASIPHPDMWMNGCIFTSQEGFRQVRQHPMKVNF